MVLTVRILQTLGFQPCYVFIPDSLQAQWITVYGRRILNKMLHPSLQILPVEITTNVYVVCVQSNWVLSLYVMNIISFTLSQISFYCIFCPLSLGRYNATKTQKDAISCRQPNPCSLPAWEGDYWFINTPAWPLFTGCQEEYEWGLNAGFHENRVILKGVIIYILHPFIIIGF